MELWSEDRVRRVLETVAKTSDARRGGLLGARLGFLMRMVAPDFHASVLGDRRLSELLQRFPDLVRLSPSPAGTDFVAQLTDVDMPPRAGNSPIAAPAAELDETLIRPLWIALVNSSPDERWFLDLENLEVASVSTDADGNLPPDSDQARAPERFLAIPPITRDEQRNVVRRSIEHLPPALQQELNALLEQDAWYSLFRQRTRDLDISDWNVAHRRFVVDRAKLWLRDHGVPLEKFVHSISRTKSSFDGMRRPMVASSWQPRLERDKVIDRRNIRGIVLRAVDRMSDDELLDLRIPLRYLI